MKLRTALLWLKSVGGVQVLTMSTRRALNLAERIEIQAGLRAGESLAEIATCAPALRLVARGSGRQSPARPP